MEHTKELLSISLSNLVASPMNVRRHSASSVEELAALIASQGLLHPLIVTEHMVGRSRAGKLKFAVAAGERRRKALLLLQHRGHLARTHEVLCELVSPERALEVSVAENSGREALHPADEFEAFKAMIDSGKGIEDVAARFGVSVLTVQRRLKLSALSPKLLALYRQDGINLDQLMALAIRGLVRDTDRKALPEQASSWLPWLIALPQAELLDLLALCGALTLNALPSAGATLDANAIAEAVDLDMADWWEPTPQGYLNHVPKAQIVQALKEAGPDLVDDAIGALKKDALVAKAHTRLAGKRWLPAPLRRPPG